MAVQRIECEATRTWTVVGRDYLPVGPVEEFLEFLRVARSASPHTVRSYARALSVWWDYLQAAGLAWDAVMLPTFTPFLSVLRTGDPVGVRRLPGTESGGGVSESTVGLRVAAVLSFYRYHADVHGVSVAGRLYRVGGRRGRGGYVRALAHLDRGREAAAPLVRVRGRGARPMPVFTPAQVHTILEGCARFDPGDGSWAGSLRDRLLFATLAETGMRLGECLSLQHRDWHVGRGATPFVEVVPRQEHPAGVRVKNSRYRRIFISDELERLHSEYVWQLCDAEAHRALDLENWWVFVNLRRGPWLAALRPESVYDLVDGLKRRQGGALPAEWTPHWFRHTHATALLLAGVREHVVMRRLGHADIQTTMSLYGWVTEDAELRAVADWASFCAGWRGVSGNGADHA